LLDNAVYQVSSWNLTAESWLSTLPTTTFTPATSTVEFCQGKCIFGSGQQWHTTLTFLNGVTRLQLGWFLADPTPLTSAPQSHEWGAFSLNDSHFRANIVPWASMTSGGLISTAISTPEPSTITYLLAAFFVLMPCFLQWASYSIRRLSSHDT
jgi:hypothetical protein